jgi:glycosyltransferase involved in cell wall biosynthesis
MKVIQINSTSSSLLVKDFENDFFRNWNAQVGIRLKEMYPKLDVECWTIERKYRKKAVKEHENMTFKIFPSTFSVRPGMEISMQMIKELKNEIKKAESENEKLIIHFHEYHSWNVYFCLAMIKKSKNVEIVCQHHGGRSPFSNLMKYKRLFLLLPAILAMQTFENLFFKKADLFFYLSDEELNYLNKKARKSRKIFQTMGIGEEYFKQIGKNSARRKLKLSLNKKYLLFLGRIKTTKGIKELIDAMKEINAELLVIGEGVDSDKYNQYARKDKINNVRFLGAKFGKDKLNYLASADCLVLPSYTEGAPVVLMEAIAMNLPVIASNVGGIPKMIENKREGLIIRPQSSKEIVNAANKILSWKKRDIKKYAEKYKWKRIIENTFREYQK